MEGGYQPAALLSSNPIKGRSEQHTSTAHTMINAIEAAQVGSRDLEGGEIKGGVGRVPQAEISASPRGG